MQKINLLFVTVLLSLFTFVACHDNEEVEPEEIKLDKTELSLIANGKKDTIKIIEGTGKFTATSADKTIATAEVKDRIIIVTPLKVGETTVKVKNTYKETTFKVVVNTPELAVKKDSVTLSFKSKTEVEITGGTAPYTVSSSDKTKATAIIKDDNKVEITAEAEEGTATITVKDAKNAEVKIVVTLGVAPEITTNKPDVDGYDENYNTVKMAQVVFIVGETGDNAELIIETGTAPYTVEDPNKGEWDALNATFTVEGNKVIFSGTEYASGNVIITDAVGKTKYVSVNVKKQLTVSKTEFEVLVGQTINNADKIKVEGHAKVIRVKSNSAPEVVEASIEESANTAMRALILTGLKAGTADIVITDGVVEKTVKVTVKAPADITLHTEDGTELDATTAYELGKFIIKGGAGTYDITFEGDLIKKPVEAKEITYGANKGDFEFTLERNINHAIGGEVTVTVTDKQDATKTKSFKVKCETLLELALTVNGTDIPKADSGEGTYYNISEGLYGGYNIYGIKLNDVIEVTVKNGAGDYKVEVDESSKIEVTQNGTNETFQITAKEDDTTYYGDITITDKTDSKKSVKISRIYID